MEIQSGVVATAEQICHLNLDFEAGYVVQFKLQGQEARLGSKLSRLKADGTVIAKASAGSAALENELEEFFKSIEGRLRRIRHEEDVQKIKYLGNTFSLNGKTVFDVISNENGKLTIEIHKGHERKKAMLLASSLLDGLYDGSVILED